LLEEPIIDEDVQMRVNAVIQNKIEESEDQSEVNNFEFEDMSLPEIDA